MKSFRNLFLVIFILISVNNIVKAQDSTVVVDISNAVLKKTDPRDVIYNQTLLIKPKNGTDSNAGILFNIKLEAGSMYSIKLLVHTEEQEEELFMICNFNKGDAETTTPTKLSGNIISTILEPTSDFAEMTLAVKKTKDYPVMVGGSKLFSDGLYCKLIVVKY